MITCLKKEMIFRFANIFIIGKYHFPISCFNAHRDHRGILARMRDIEGLRITVEDRDCADAEFFFDEQLRSVVISFAVRVPKISEVQILLFSWYFIDLFCCPW